MLYSEYRLRFRLVYVAKTNRQGLHLHNYASIRFDVIIIIIIIMIQLKLWLDMQSVTDNTHEIYNQVGNLLMDLSKL